MPTFENGIFSSSDDLDLYEGIKARLAEYNLESLADTVLNLVQTYGSDMKETVNAKLRETDAYKQRFAGNEGLVKANLPKLSEAEYLYNERQYDQTFSAYGAKDLASRSNFADLIGKNVSPQELADRFNLAVDKVQKADPALKKQLQKMYPGISDTELTRSLLLGKEGSRYLESRIGQAEILTEADTAGLTLQSDVAELQARGVTRAKATEGLSAVSGALPGLKQAASIYGDTGTPESLQKELESEVLLGQTSKRTKRLASQARAAFEGTSGSVSGSIKKRSSGLI
jgi:hypothetical protein